MWEVSFLYSFDLSDAVVQVVQRFLQAKNVRVVFACVSVEFVVGMIAVLEILVQYLD